RARRFAVGPERARRSAARRGRHAARRRRRVSRRRPRAACGALARARGGGRAAMTVRITWRRIITAIAALVVAAFLVAWSGVIHVGASTGHAAITDWFLHWAMRNTVRTYAALTVDTPAADPEGLVSAAGHFAGHCAVCHGAPGERPSPQMQAATPHAPDLAITAPSYSDAELFWIVKHGVKFTGKPAWPSLERDDEVRRMAAFVRRLPDMTAPEYHALAYGPGSIVGTLAGARPTTLEHA